MNFVSFGIASVFVASASLLACGGSSDGGGGAGGPSSSAGSHSSAGSSSTGGSGAGGSTQLGSAGSCGTVTTMLDPSSQMCPGAVSCIQTKCQSALDALAAPTGACNTCANACNCEQACVQNCLQASACQAGLQTYLTCAQSSCLSELLSCANAGTGGAGGGASSSGKTCADMDACCATLTDATEKTSCTQIAALKSEAACGLAYASFCN